MWALPSDHHIGDEVALKKSFSHALDAASGFNDYQLPITTMLRDMYASLCEHGGAGVDHSGLFLEIERMNKSTDKVAFP